VHPYHETRAYVARIVRDFNKKKSAQQKAAASTEKSLAKKTKPSTGTHQSAGSVAVAQMRTQPSE
jgi:BRCT domain type II-containing protein